MTAPTVTEELGKQVPELGIIRAGGRYFISSAKTTARQDHYVLSRLNEAGLEELQGQVNDNGDMSDFAIRLIKAAYEKDILFEIVGALLTEVDEKGEPLPLIDKRGRPQRWTIEKAEEIADFVANLDDPNEKESFHTIINAVLILFFTTGVAPLTDSQNSSEEALGMASQATPISSETPADGLSTSDAESLLAKTLALGGLDPTITASGTTRSEKSPDTTPTN